MKTKIIILAIVFLSVVANAQIMIIDLTTRTTNIVFTIGHGMSVPGQFTNSDYTVSNNFSVTIGDSIPTAFGKVNSTFIYFSNQLYQLALIPTQINTNFFLYATGVSNYTFTVFTYLQTTAATNFGSGYTFTNGFYYGKFTGSLNDTSLSTGTLGYIPIADGSGGFAWSAPNIISDSSGHGGTTLHLKSSDTGSDEYIHVTSTGVITASGSP